jgi:hypothetical protein
MILIGVNVGCNGKKAHLSSLMKDASSGLIQTKKINDKVVVMELLPDNSSGDLDKDAGNNLYRLKFTLISNETIKDKAEMQYMNFNIKNSFYAVQGKDTLPCAICERIPGISDKEFLYIVCFNRLQERNVDNSDLRLCIADTTAGFGLFAFEIKKEALTKLKGIK